MDGRNVQQGVRAAEIVCVAVRYIRQPFPAFGHHIGVLPVIPQDIGYGVTLLKHIAASGQIVRPVFGVFRPSLVAAEPLAENEQAQARAKVVGRLVGAFVDEEPVEAGQHGQIGRNLQVAGIPGVRASVHAVGGK